MEQLEEKEIIPYDVIVVGAGAAGMMAAGTAARNGKRVLLIEKMEKSGRKVRITGKGRFRDEFVTCGGVSLSSIDMHTLQSKHCPGLFFAGEVIDVDAITGGFNLQAAWTMGYVVGQHIGEQ